MNCNLDLPFLVFLSLTLSSLVKTLLAIGLAEKFFQRPFFSSALSFGICHIVWAWACGLPQLLFDAQ
jgi:hypothetical protein